MYVKENIIKIKNRINEICSKRKYDTGAVTIVAVTKMISENYIIEAINSGITDIGENRVQEAEKKFPNLPLSFKIKKHMIGHLQSNKVKKAVSLFDVIQSVDSFKIAEEINKHALNEGKIQDCMIEVKISDEPTKFGCKPEELTELIKKIFELKNIKLTGLMTIAPLNSDKEELRLCFSKVRELFFKIKSEFTYLEHFNFLSMGMTDDYDIAVEEGSNMVRIGRAIFGKRNG